MLSCTNRLLYGFGFFLLVHHAASQNWDGPSPYTDEVAPDVTLANNWNSSFPDFESIESSYPALISGSDGGNASEDTSRLAPRAAKDFYLRVLPLGASIVQGISSSDGNGFRKLLRQQLRWVGWKVNMVGTKNNGDMSDNDNQGHPGHRIDQVHDEWKKSSVNGLKPNLVLINAGTNDCGQNRDTANAGARMRSMIDDIYDKVPGVTIVLSTLVKSRNHRACAEDLSRQYRDLVRNQYRGKRMGLADIDSNIQMSQIDGDGIHPNDEGYKLFAAVWWDAISTLENEIQPPPTDGLIKDDSQSTGQRCPKVAGNAGGPVQTQKGSGHDDGNYKHNRIARGAIESARIQKLDDPRTITAQIPLSMYFADIIKNDPNSDRSLALDDWIRVFTAVDGKRTYYFRQNLGGGKFGSSRTFDPGMNCPSPSTHAFGDFNNDGFDDFFCLGSGGGISVSLNRGGSPPRFESIGQIVPASSTSGGFVHIADIDGDGRADFCVVAPGGVVRCSRNGGQGDNYFWQGFSNENGLRGIVFDKTQNPTSLYYFGDINGDYRSDILRIGNNGNVETWINRRGRGSGIVPDWVSSGITHQGQPVGPLQNIRNNIKFGKIYGSNRLDYIYIKEEEDYFDVLVWENTGSGGTKLKADGTFYCDMRGTGSDDYVWIYADGHSNEIFANTHNPPFWDPNYSFTLNVGAHRTLIHLADWTGNGRCDVLVQNKVTSAVTLWENQWNAGTRTLTFANRGVVASPGCGKSTGVSIFDRSMRIADIDGDGRADVVCFQLDGRLTGWLNTRDGLRNVGQIKFDEGWDRANLRLADVENSGRADIIWLNKYTGAGSVWKNNGYQGPNGGGGGSSFSWTKRGVLYSPIDRGEVMNFANLGGLGRADLIQVYPTTNEAYTFFNKCPGGGAGGDDGAISDPKLPVVSGGSTPAPDNTDDRYYVKPENEPEGQGPDQFDDRNLLGTRLSGWYGCSTAQSNAIMRAYKDAIDMLSQPQVSVPNWYTEIAEDFFGSPSAVSDEVHNQILNVLQNAGTVTHGWIINPFKWTLNVRCNEREGRSKCTQTPPEDPCGNDENQVLTPSDTIAYTHNQEHIPNNAEITFCPQFFKERSMKDALAYGESLPATRRWHLENYRGQADIFLHELFHVDLAANSFDNRPNPHIMDVHLSYETPSGMSHFGAYGTEWAKLLARYDKDSVIDEYLNDVGFYVQRNADNYALFCLAWRVYNTFEFYPDLPRRGTQTPKHPPKTQYGKLILERKKRQLSEGRPEICEWVRN